MIEGDHIEFKIHEEDAPRPRRLDRFLADRLPELSRSRVQQLIRSGHITVGGVVPKAKLPVEPGMTVCVEIPPPRPAHARPQDLPLKILHADADLAVIDKAPGMVVHPGAGNPDGTLVNALLHHFQGLSSIGGVERPGIVHRLDKETSGCLVVAFNNPAHEALSNQFSDRTVGKQYLAVVAGPPARESGTIESRIGRNPGNRQKMTVLDPPAGKTAVTRFRVLGRHRNSALVLCDLLTGRTHQIRVHLKSIGHPLLGDTIYGRSVAEHSVDRLMLHAWRLAFVHPGSGEKLRFEADIPPAFTPWITASPPLPGPIR